MTTSILRCVLMLCAFVVAMLPAVVRGDIWRPAGFVAPRGKRSLHQPSLFEADKRSFRNIMLRYMDKPRGASSEEEEEAAGLVQQPPPMVAAIADPEAAVELLSNNNYLVSPADDPAVAAAFDRMYNQQQQQREERPLPAYVDVSSSLKSQRPVSFRGKKNGFAAFRGKKSDFGFSAFRGKKDSGAGDAAAGYYGFSGFRGRRSGGGYDDDFGFSAFRGKKGADAAGFVGFRGKKPSGFMGARGKRFNRSGSRNNHAKRADDDNSDEDAGQVQDANSTSPSARLSSSPPSTAAAVVDASAFLKTPESSQEILSFLQSLRGAIVEPDSELHSASTPDVVRRRGQRSPLGVNMGYLASGPTASAASSWQANNA